MCLQPAIGSQVSTVQRFASSQSSGPGERQTPAWHASAPLHAFASAQVVPSATGTWVQPVAGSQASVVQTLWSSQLGAVPIVHVPEWHVSTPLQALLSLHDEAIGSQVSLVRGLKSLQLTGGPATQTPPV